MPRPITCTIFPQNIAYNLQILKQKLLTAKIFAVLKANAYGHGIDNIYSGLKEADGIAVLDLQEAVKIRELGWNKPLLLLEGFFNYSDLHIVKKYGLITTVHSQKQIQMLDKFNADVDIYLKVNTGMNRLGFDSQIYLDIYSQIKSKAWLNSLTHMTHFAQADEINGINEQLNLFNLLTKDLPEPKSSSNSGAILWHKNAHFDWVRAGISLYGASPSGNYADIKTLNLKSCMNFETEIISIQNIKKGNTVGYGARFVAQYDMKIAILACGYADGYPRHAPDGTPIIIKGIQTVLVGKVSMDMITVDITNIDAKIGDKAQMWGDLLPIDEVAKFCGTIGYELMCAIAPRVNKYTVD